MKSALLSLLLSLAVTGCVTRSANRVIIDDRSRSYVTLNDGRKRAILKKAAPEYPAWMRTQRIGGRVLVRFWIAANGVVTRAEAQQPPHPELGRIAEAAMRQWVFEPAADGKELVLQNELFFEVM